MKKIICLLITLCFVSTVFAAPKRADMKPVRDFMDKGSYIQINTNDSVFFIDRNKITTIYYEIISYSYYNKIVIVMDNSFIYEIKNPQSVSYNPDDFSLSINVDSSWLGLEELIQKK